MSDEDILANLLSLNLKAAARMSEETDDAKILAEVERIDDRY